MRRQLHSVHDATNDDKSLYPLNNLHFIDSFSCNLYEYPNVPTTNFNIILFMFTDSHLRRQGMLPSPHDGPISGHNNPGNNSLNRNIFPSLGNGNNPGGPNGSSAAAVAAAAAAAVAANNRDNNSNSNPPFPLQVAFDLSNSMKRKDLFSQRKQREFIPDNKKDDSYWDRRRRNNEAAKRSREKRRFNDMVLETRVIELTKENHILKAQLVAIKDKYGINGESLISLEQVLASMPSNEQLLSFTKRTKLFVPGESCPPSPPNGLASMAAGLIKVVNEDSSAPPSNESSDHQHSPSNSYSSRMGEDSQGAHRSRSPLRAHRSHQGQQHETSSNEPLIDVEKNEDDGPHNLYNLSPREFSPQMAAKSAFHHHAAALQHRHHHQFNSEGLLSSRTNSSSSSPSGGQQHSSGSSPNGTNGHNGHSLHHFNRRTNSLSPSENILNLSISCNQSSTQRMETDHSDDSDEGRSAALSSRRHPLLQHHLPPHLNMNHHLGHHKVTFADNVETKEERGKLSPASATSPVAAATAGASSPGTPQNSATSGVANGNTGANNANGAASNLPHKLRHKTLLGSEKEFHHYPYGTLLKQESQVSPCGTSWDHDESGSNSGSGSSDERDSGISINGEIINHRQQPSPLSSFKNGSPGAGANGSDGNGKTINGNTNINSSNNNGSTAVGDGETKPEDFSVSSPSQRKRAKKRYLDETKLEVENCQLKSELARLATEVACLKNFLVKEKPEDGSAEHENEESDSA